MLVTGVAGTTWNVTRAIENTQAATSVIGTTVDHILTAGAIDQIRADLVTVGAYAALPSPGSNRTGDIFVPTDSFYDIIRYNGSTWDHFRNGHLMTLPIDSNYTWDNTGNGTITTTNGGIVGISRQAISSTLQARYKTAPSTPYTITIAFLPHYLQTSNSQIGLAFRDSSSGKLATGGVSYNSGWNMRFGKWTTTSSFSADYSSIGIPPLLVHGPLTWLRAADDGTNRIFSVSSNGVTWSTVHSVGRTDFLTANQVAFYWGDANQDVGLTLLHWKEA